MKVGVRSGKAWSGAANLTYIQHSACRVKPTGFLGDMKLEKAIQHARQNWQGLKSSSELEKLASRILNELGNVSINQLDMREIDRKKWSHLAPATRAKRATILQQIVRAGIEAGGRGITMPIMPRIKINNANPEFLTTSEVETIRMVEDSEVVRDFILWQFHTGMRPSESKAVLWDDIDNGSVIVRTSKTGKARRIPLSSAVQSMLRRRSKELERVWCDLPSDTSVRNKWQSSVRKGLGREGTHNLSLYVLRHSFASKLVQDGVRVEVVRDLMGHADIKMTLRYAKLNDKSKQDAINAVF